MKNSKSLLVNVTATFAVIGLLPLLPVHNDAQEIGVDSPVKRHRDLFDVDDEVSSKKFHANDGVSELHVAAFNIQQFGKRKFNNETLRTVIARVLSQFDITFVQEILRNVSYVSALLSHLNSISSTRVFDFRLSEPLGKCGNTAYTERHAYFFDTKSVELVSTCHWPGERSYRPEDRCVDEATTRFTRPPFVARFKVAGKLEFGFIGIHSAWQQQKTLFEVGQLKAVYDRMSELWKLENFIIGGDLNTRTGEYDRLHELPIYNNSQFLWAIDDNVVTTTKTINTYDRLILAGVDLRKRFVDASAFHYTDTWDDVNLKTAQEVSDHWPVNLTLATG